MGYRVLVLGAAYGLLPSLRILTAGHLVTIVCRQAEQQEFLDRGATVVLGTDTYSAYRLAAGGRSGFSQDGMLGLVNPDVPVEGFDLVLLAMSEPHYAAPEIANLLNRIALARLPVIALMNMPPPAFLRRLSGTLDVDALAPAYSAWQVWQRFDPDFVSATSPDAQAVRLSTDTTGVLTVTLASNFKVAPFARPEHQKILEKIAADVSLYRPNGAPLPTRIVPHAELHIPLAKWPMLATGNIRCLTPEARVRSIAEAVHADLAASERIYDQVMDLVRDICDSAEGLVPFHSYARAARRLSRPSSFARAVAAGASHVERIDRMIHLATQSRGMRIEEVARVVGETDRLLGR